MIKRYSLITLAISLLTILAARLVDTSLVHIANSICIGGVIAYLANVAYCLVGLQPHGAHGAKKIHRDMINALLIRLVVAAGLFSVVWQWLIVKPVWLLIGFTIIYSLFTWVVIKAKHNP